MSVLRLHKVAASVRSSWTASTARIRLQLCYRSFGMGRWWLEELKRGSFAIADDPKLFLFLNYLEIQPSLFQVSVYKFDTNLISKTKRFLSTLTFLRKVDCKNPSCFSTLPRPFSVPRSHPNSWRSSNLLAALTYSSLSIVKSSMPFERRYGSARYRFTNSWMVPMKCGYSSRRLASTMFDLTS